MLRPLIAGFLLLTAAAFPQTKSLSKSMAKGPHRMELTLEKKFDSGWRVVDPGTVFEKNDLLRFRYKTNFDGLLYVMNQGTSGTYVKLFPREDTGTANQVKAGKEYMVPATGLGSFRVDGPAGFDIIYWVINPETREKAYQPLPPPPTPTADLPANLTPRCDDTILRARGDCVDSSAGAQTVQDRQKLPSNIKGAASDASQDLVIRKNESVSVVASPAPLTGPVVYEFRLAHK
ncbi:MAG: DUF4384 domain-containing protein [Acidobacteria bacterium]|nr:DUF4384 domain-containing protein [Acidobacteriota bacterium]